MENVRAIKFMAFAKSLAELSKCTEIKVAAVITDSSLTQIYSIGINGGATGLDDCMCVTDGKYGCLHAEINALVKCTVPREADKIMFVTLSPCKQCAAAIINAGGFKKVFYGTEWKDDTGIKLLKNANISTIHL